MEISLEKQIHQEIVVFNTRNISEIQFILTEILYVPDERLRLVVILELLDYFKEKFSDPDYKIEFFYTKENEDVSGFVVCQIDKDYKSYGMKCPTFGWLHAKDYRSCELLMNECEDFVRRNKYRKLRGPINFPKVIGGIGIQERWFNRCAGFVCRR